MCHSSEVEQKVAYSINVGSRALFKTSGAHYGKQSDWKGLRINVAGLLRSSSLGHFHETCQLNKVFSLDTSQIRIQNSKLMTTSYSNKKKQLECRQEDAFHKQSANDRNQGFNSSTNCSLSVLPTNAYSLLVHTKKADGRCGCVWAMSSYGHVKSS